MFICLLAAAQSGHFYTSDKLSSNQIVHLCQDKTGYIWVATEYGLNKYDGYRFTNYLHDANDSTSVCCNVISHLFTDSKGNLWVGTREGLEYYDPVADKFEHIKMEGAKEVPRRRARTRGWPTRMTVRTAIDLSTASWGEWRS